MTESRSQKRACRVRRVCDGEIFVVRVVLTVAAVLSFLQIVSSESTANAQPRKSTNRDFDTFGFSLLFRPGSSADSSEYSSGDPSQRIDAALAKNPNDMFYMRLKATQLAKKGEKAKAVELLKKAIKLQIQKKQRYASPYFELAGIYRRAKQYDELRPLLKEMISRFPDNKVILQEVAAHNRALKDKDVHAKLEVAAQKINGTKLVAKTLHDIQPAHPRQLKKGMCYQITANTDCFPKFRLKLLPDRCVASSGVASYFVSPPTYERIILFNPETKNYATSTIGQLMKHHQNITVNRAEAQYRDVQKIGNEAVNGHPCSVYKCHYWGDDNHEKIYLSDSISVLEPLAYSIAQITQTPYSHCVPMKCCQVIEGHSFEVLSMHSLVEAKTADADFRLPAGAHRVATLNDVIFDSNMVESMFMSK